MMQLHETPSQSHYTIKLGDIISMEVVSRDKIGHPLVAKPYRPPLDLSRFTSFTFGVTTITITRVTAIRPWTRWAIPATRCQRIRGEK